MTGYIADTSVLARYHLAPVRDRLDSLLSRGLVSLCSATELEFLRSARSRRDYERLKDEFLSMFTWTAIDERVWDQALGVLRNLVPRGHHRAPSVPDLLLAVVAARARLTVLHYDRDFDTIAGVTGQATEWVVPAGSV
ncbi:PIN domain nuclease [Cryptosporangium phraense]|uniref:Ribonuclease VapC n=1 Tax=Cryptosporangium phraense TaxID=2593070 RepID=A0A545ASG8_9ACTN|nr:PIN domain nuclease [Cryptosporangium phraense]TQS44282.1 PIN domain nuclease [Cryptosporangium phraense]